MAKSLTLVKIADRILYRTDGVTQVSVLDTTISGMDSGRLDDNELLSLHDNFVVPSQNNLFRSATSFPNYQRTRLAWVHKPTANCGGHSEMFSLCGQIWIENCSHPASDRRKNVRQTYNSRLWLSIVEALGAFEKHLRDGRERWNLCHGLRFLMMKISFPRLAAHLKSKSTSPIVFQINSKTNFPEWNSS